MGGGMAGALALTRPTVMTLMLVLHGGCAALTHLTVMKLMSGFAWRVRWRLPALR